MTTARRSPTPAGRMRAIHGPAQENDSAPATGISPSPSPPSQRARGDRRAVSAVPEPQPAQPAQQHPVPGGVVLPPRRGHVS
ncbi:MAG TPA: hypothetical protein VKV80_05210 [Streptosporangiaceae bacterium]|nr:hypothetical protein [Streptosporangiaceae bacterium]